MKINDLKVEEVIEFNHARKGKIIGKVLNNDSESEWINVQLLNKVHGLSNSWEEGEELSMRKSLITDFKKIE